MTTQYLTFEALRDKLIDGEKLSDISSQSGIPYYTLQKLLERNGTSVRKIVPPKIQVLKKNLDQWNAEGLTHSQVAERIGVTDQQLYSMLYMHRLKIGRGRRPRRACDEDLQNKTDLALEYLFTKGGSVRSICRELRFEEQHHQVRRVMVDRGVDPLEFYFAFRRYAGWITIPGHPEGKANGGNQKIPCRCITCGVVTHVRLNNLLSGKSQGCKKCTTYSRMSVLVVATGQTFDSLLSVCKELDLLEDYGNIRYHLKSKGEYSINGYTLQVVETKADNQEDK